jgi:hypothetical protein
MEDVFTQEHVASMPLSRQQLFSDTPYPLGALETYMPPLSPNAFSQPSSFLDELSLLAPGSPAPLVPPPVPLPALPPILARAEEQGPGSAAPAGTQSAAAQTKTSCDSCKVSHVKCTGEQPCFRCNRNQMLCTYGAFKVVRGPNGDHIRDLRHKIQKLQEQSHAQQAAIHGLQRSASQDERNAEFKRRRYTISPFVPAMNLRYVLDLYTQAFRGSETRLGLWTEVMPNARLVLASFVARR